MIFDIEKLHKPYKKQYWILSLNFWAQLSVIDKKPFFLGKVLCIPAVFHYCICREQSIWASMSSEAYGMWTVRSCLWLSQAKAINRGHLWLQCRVLRVLHYWSPVATSLKGLEPPKCCWHPQDFDLIRDVVHMSGSTKIDIISHALCRCCEESFRVYQVLSTWHYFLWDALASLCGRSMN